MPAERPTTPGSSNGARVRHRRNDRGERTRAAIVEAAVRLFAERGFRGTSVTAVAEAAGLTQQGLLHHFTSKEELLLAVLAARETANREVAGPRGDALGAPAAVVRMNAEQPELARFFTVVAAEAIAPGHPAHDWFQHRYEQLLQRSTMRLEIGVERGEVRPDVATVVVARMILAMMDGLQLQWLLDPSLDMVATFEEFTAVLGRDLAAHRNGPSATSGVAAEDVPTSSA